MDMRRMASRSSCYDELRGTDEAGVFTATLGRLIASFDIASSSVEAFRLIHMQSEDGASGHIETKPLTSDGSSRIPNFTLPMVYPADIRSTDFPTQKG
jgi:hypothetical protein